MRFIADIVIYSLSYSTRRDRKKMVKMIYSVLFDTGSKKYHVRTLETGEQMFISQVMYLGIDDQSGMSVPEGMSGTDKLLLRDLDLQRFELHINFGMCSEKTNKCMFKSVLKLRYDRNPRLEIIASSRDTSHLLCSSG